MEIDFGILGKVVLEECERLHNYDEGAITHSGYTEQGIRIHVFVGNGKSSSFVHGELWRNAILIDNKFLELL